MRILAHRGWHNDAIADNSPRALEEAMRRGYGFESDVRDFDGRLVISHYTATNDCQDVSEVLGQLAAYHDRLPFAINIKADGLDGMLHNALCAAHIENYFTFDMSVPQMIVYREKGIRYFTRQSDAEKTPVLYEEAAGVWMDAFFDDRWITHAVIRAHLANGKQIAVVSPELHRREYLPLWQSLRDAAPRENAIFLCTDRPDEAKQFFHDLIYEVTL